MTFFFRYILLYFCIIIFLSKQASQVLLVNQKSFILTNNFAHVYRAV